jgi:hypothetical protein
MPLEKNFDKDKIVSAVQEDDELGMYAAEALRKLVEPFVPYNTGRLCHDVTIKPFEIHYNAPYAETVYNDLKRNFRKDKHPLATANWVEVAMPTIRDYLAQDIQEFINRKGLNV